MEADRLADAIDTLASAVEGNMQEMKALRDAIDDLRTEYVHAIRNAECPYLAEAKAVRRILPSFPLDDALEMELTPDQIRQAVAEGVTTVVGLRRIEKNTRADEVPETISAPRCDVDSPASLAAALQDGWTDICRDDGAGWNYLGVCPECQAQEIATTEPETVLEDPQKELFGYATLGVGGLRNVCQHGPLGNPRYVAPPDRRPNAGVELLPVARAACRLRAPRGVSLSVLPVGANMVIAPGLDLRGVPAFLAGTSVPVGQQMLRSLSCASFYSWGLADCAAKVLPQGRRTP